MARRRGMTGGDWWALHRDGQTGLSGDSTSTKWEIRQLAYLVNLQYLVSIVVDDFDGDLAGGRWVEGATHRGVE